ncbi:MAG: ABC transporter permease [Acidobacteria bacterium]|nr:ABC transporter permease [Acidobacteriota bacterium]
MPDGAGRARVAGLLRLGGWAGGELVAAVPLLAGLAVWELAGWMLGFRFLPPFSRVLATAVGMIAGGELMAPLGASLLSLAAGYLPAAGLGVTLGLLMGRSRGLEFVLSPYLNAFMATPRIALVPILYIVLGLNRAVQAVVVFLGAFFVIVWSTMRGVRSADRDHVEMARAFGATKRQVMWKILLPSALPLTLAGLRLGIGQAIRAMIAAEMFIAVFGLGALLRTYGGRFDAERLLAVLLVVVAVALVCALAAARLDRHLTAWSRTPR